MESTTVPDPRAQPTLTVKEAARLMGISRNLAYEAVREGQIPSIKLGRRLVVPTARLLAILGIETPEHAA